MKRVACFLSLVIFVALAPALAQADQAKFHFIDVGDGDSILIEVDKVPKRWALVDTGNLISGRKVAEYMKSRGVDRLDYLILSHAHMDHTGGAFLIAQSMDIGAIYDNGEPLTDPPDNRDYYKWYIKLLREKDNYGRLKAGDKLSLDALSINVIWPDENMDNRDYNENSLVLQLGFGKFRLLLMGDLPVSGESMLIKSDVNLKSDVLKAGHHGASDCCQEAFLKAADPAVAIVSVGADNSLGYPSSNVIKRIENAGVKLLRTDKDGTIVVVVDDNGKYKIIP